MVNSKNIVNIVSPVTKFINLTSLLDQMKGMPESVFFEILIELKESGANGEKQYITEPERFETKGCSIATLNEQLHQINQLNGNYNSLMKKANDTLIRIQNEYDGRGLKISFIMRKRGAVGEPKTKLEKTCTSVTPEKLEKQKKPNEVYTKVNNLLNRVKEKCDEVFFDILLETQMSKAFDKEQRAIELKEIRSFHSFYGKRIRSYKEGCYNTTKL